MDAKHEDEKPNGVVDIDKRVASILADCTLELGAESLTFAAEDAVFVNEAKAHEYLCSICQCVCEEPYDIGCDGGHIFCKECIDDYIKEKNADGNNNEKNNGNLNAIDTVQCPDCDSCVKIKEISSNKFVKRQIQTLRVKCPNFNQYKCDWVGTLKDTKSHINNTCKFSKVLCPLCKDNDVKNCIVRKDIEKHLESDCDYLKIECKNKHFGCKTIKIRKNMTNHEKNECKFNFNNETDAMKYRIDILETTVSKQNDEINDLKSTVSMLMETIKTKSKQIERLTQTMTEFESQWKKKHPIEFDNDEFHNEFKDGQNNNNNHNNNNNNNKNNDKNKKNKEDKEKDDENKQQGSDNVNDAISISTNYKERMKNEKIYSIDQNGIKIVAYSIYKNVNQIGSNETRIVIARCRKLNQFPSLLYVVFMSNTFVKIGSFVYYNINIQHRTYDGMACVEVNRGGKRGAQYDGLVTKESLVRMKDGTISTRMSALFHKKLKYLLNVNVGHLLKMCDQKYDSFVIGTKLFDLYEKDVLSKCTKNEIDSIILPLDMGISSNWYLNNRQYPMQTLVCILTDVIKAIRSHQQLYKMKEIMLVIKTTGYWQALQTVLPMFFDNFTVLQDD